MLDNWLDWLGDISTAIWFRAAIPLLVGLFLTWVIKKRSVIPLLVAAALYIYLEVAYMLYKLPLDCPWWKVG